MSPAANTDAGLGREDLAAQPALLEVAGLSVSYGGVRAVRDASLRINAGEIVSILGANGAGKSSLLGGIAGLVRAEGRITFAGVDLAGLAPEKRVRSGLVLVPEGRRLFAGLSVADNLALGAATRRDRDGITGDLERLSSIFNVLATRSGDAAGTLSGGQQQMVAIARALMSRPKLLLLDEPSLGLAPVVIDRVFELIAALRDEGATILLVEQSVEQALAISDRAYVMSTGRLAASASAESLLNSDTLHLAYLGMDA
jgi:branched-chain amino acid transport system ATP-binding protein